MASRIISLACSLAFSSSFSFFASNCLACFSSSSFCLRISAVIRTASSRSSSARFLSSSRDDMTSSKAMSPPSSKVLALSVIPSGSPSLCDISKALDFPGRPVISLYVGLRVSTSNSIEAFSTSSVDIAYFFNSV